ncbi:MAG: hypothetical protein ACFFD1_00140 [Candidatus Thorarchaeota archaeon]
MNTTQEKSNHDSELKSKLTGNNLNTKTAIEKERQEEWQPLVENLSLINRLPLELETELRKEGYDWHFFIMNHKNKPYKIQQKLKNGWEVIYYEKSSIDQRPNATKDLTKTKAAPIIVQTSDGYRGIWLKKKTELRMQDYRESLNANKELKDAATAKGKFKSNDPYIKEAMQNGRIVGDYNHFNDYTS